MNILLINPFGRELNVRTNRLISTYLEEPLGLMYISAYLKEYTTGHQIELLDASLELEKNDCGCMESLWGMIRDKITDFKPELVGISACYYSNSAIVNKTARLVKEVRSDTLVVIGGSFASHLPEVALMNPAIDICVFSEGEETFRQIAEARAQNTPYASIDGIAYRDSAGKIRINPKQQFIEDLDRIPFPDRAAVPLQEYLSGGRRVIYRYYEPRTMTIGALTATRGCPNQCIFCGSKAFWGRRIRYRSPERIISEMCDMKERYGVDTFVFNDDNQCASRSHFSSVLDLMIARLPGIRWHSGGGLNIRSINKEEIIRKMVQSGICFFNLAIESGQNQSLKRIKKPLTIEEVSHCIGLIRKYGDIPIHGFFINGFPFETLDDIRANIEFARSLELDWVCLYNLQPFPGSEVYKQAMQEGQIEGFNIDYGENFCPSNIRYSGYSARDVSRINYDANIDINFIHNPNRVRNPRRAIRDFDYVLNLVPDHWIALYCKALTLQKIGDAAGAGDCFEKVQKNLTADHELYPYFEKYQLLDKLFIS